MPNWCDNEIEITGSSKSIDKLLELVIDNATRKASQFEEPVIENHYSLLETFLPVSDYFVTQEGYNRGGYEWCIETWGCKWPERNFEFVRVSEEQLDLRFDTPWSPPEKGYRFVSTIFPDLMFHHYFRDEGLCFLGIISYQNGIMVFDQELDLNNLPSFGDDWNAFEDHLYGEKLVLFSQAKASISFPE